ncbi:MAG: hypothetical protein JXA90_05665 [Planctomycetes bacterium]|nr:hypothetical protein [Planctomycetota bacterium]
MIARHSAPLALASGMLLLVLAAGPSARAVSFIRGDVDQNGAIELTDPVRILMYLFLDGTSVPGCLDAADVDDSGTIDLSDAVYSLNFLFLGGPLPPLPHPECGVDPTDDALDCREFSGDVCPAAPPSGSLISYKGCKDFPDIGGVPPDQACIQYVYESGVLHLTHVNAGFNCCPDALVAEIIFDEGAITIREAEIGGVCFCCCLYDMEVEIVDLAAMEYTVRIGEPYLREPDEPFELTIDLAEQPEGRFCLPRTQYPWGVY